MKKILFLFFITFAITACSLEKEPDTNVYHNSKRTEDVYRIPVIHITDAQSSVNLRVVIIDSCEYLIGNSSCGYQGYGYLTHKGNCKYCAERRKRELEKYVKE